MAYRRCVFYFKCEIPVLTKEVKADEPHTMIKPSHVRRRDWSCLCPKNQKLVFAKSRQKILFEHSLLTRHSSHARLVILLLLKSKHREIKIWKVSVFWFFWVPFRGVKVWLLIFLLTQWWNYKIFFRIHKTDR